MRLSLIIHFGFMVATLRAGHFAEVLYQDSFIWTQSIASKPRSVTDDDLGNLYIINTDNALEKYDSTGRIVSKYSNQRLGRATYMDATNPMRPLLWYQDFQTIVFLDRNLTEMGRLSLSELGFQQVPCIATASDGNIWIYDPNTFRLLKITPDGKSLFESPAMNQMEQPPLDLHSIIECNDRVVLSDFQKRVWIFDLFAQPDHIQITSAPVSRGRMVNNHLVYIHENQLIMERTGFFKPRLWPLPSKGNWYVGRNKIVLLGSDQVDIYVFKQ